MFSQISINYIKNAKNVIVTTLNNVKHLKDISDKEKLKNIIFLKIFAES